MSNLHLLLRVSSFSRWPLKLHFFAPDVHSAWVKWCATANEPVRKSLAVETDFGPRPADEVDSGQSEAPWGIHALPLDYAPAGDYVAKGQSIFSFEREGNCAICDGSQAPGQGLYAVCTNETCEAVGHVAC